jgi:hypothetical protein
MRDPSGFTFDDSVAELGRRERQRVWAARTIRELRKVVRQQRNDHLQLEYELLEEQERPGGGW